MKYKMVVVDVDGTLLNNNREITTITRDSVKKFRNMGGIFTLATGRGIKSASPYIEALNLDVPVILFNGCIIYHPFEKKILYKRFLPDTLYKLIAELWQTGRYNVNMLVFSLDGIFVKEITDIIRLYMAIDHVQCDVVEDMTCLNSIIKVMLIGNTKVSMQLVHDLKNMSKEPFTYVQSDEFFIEILPFSVTKGTTLKKLCELINININNVVAIGDQDNDKEMICTAGYGIAMGNADEKLKKCAKYIAKTNIQNGVSDVLEKIMKDII
ncbi:Cof-type HAD-IIB family hydrolase [Thermoanaerobacterium sp. RBIITD]|uniref:Cof-type HAD-IIB family hydrolase n=1 Tax=Thermoanaerobacterium sp. RBIITD TaxID=1550240 RepID=UPI000BB73F44|nr:Cof-type HAD-IIB family hydrolase [Thermoanaerobacterium sp. RBIITD]SNX52731.1 hypothetical protein SAMN05660242_0161 [Thermoanaerobacterium sp. RBIITD]